jgi:hypothetical protein
LAIGWQALIVALLAGFVGLAELVGRYRSDPRYALTQSAAAWIYIAVNAAAGVGALLLITAFDWKFGQTEHVDLWRILIAGFGAIAFFRSSLFVARVGGSSVGVGPSLVLGALLDACDRDVDRKSALAMSSSFRPDLLRGLDPDRVMFSLPVLCLALMQNFPAADQAQLGAELAGIRNDENLDPEAKMRAVMIQLSKALGSPLVLNVLANARTIFEPRPASAPVGVMDTGALIEQARKQLEDRGPTELQPDTGGT